MASAPREPVTSVAEAADSVAPPPRTRPTTPPAQSLAPLHGLRAIASCLVVFAHVIYALGLAPYSGPWRAMLLSLPQLRVWGLGLAAMDVFLTLTAMLSCMQLVAGMQDRSHTPLQVSSHTPLQVRWIWRGHWAGDFKSSGAVFWDGFLNPRLRAHHLHLDLSLALSGLRGIAAPVAGGWSFPRAIAVVVLQRAARAGRTWCRWAAQVTARHGSVTGQSHFHPNLRALHTPTTPRR